MLSDKTESKNLNAALNFLHFLDPSGFLSSAADPTKISTMLDESLVERNQRIVTYFNYYFDLVFKFFFILLKRMQ